MFNRTFVKDIAELDTVSGQITRRVKQVWEQADEFGNIIQRSWSERIYENGVFVGEGSGTEGEGSAPYNWE